MVAYHGAEFFELVGLFLFNYLANEFGKNNIGLYKHDGIAIF